MYNYFAIVLDINTPPLGGAWVEITNPSQTTGQVWDVFQQVRLAVDGFPAATLFGRP